MSQNNFCPNCGYKITNLHQCNNCGYRLSSVILLRSYNPFSGKGSLGGWEFFFYSVVLYCILIVSSILVFTQFFIITLPIAILVGFLICNIINKRVNAITCIEKDFINQHELRYKNMFCIPILVGTSSFFATALKNEMFALVTLLQILGALIVTIVFAAKKEKPLILSNTDNNVYQSNINSQPQRGEDLKFELTLTKQQILNRHIEVINGIEVKIPSEVLQKGSGSKLRVQGQGDPGINGGSNGDLYIILNIIDESLNSQQESDSQVKTSYKDCPICNGSGKILKPDYDKYGPVAPHMGKSTYIEETCSECSE